MINKKLIFFTALSIAFSSSAFAKTEGNYVGLNLINTSTSYQFDSGRVRNDNYSFGVDYKYAFNFGKLFVAPGLFYDHNALSESVSIYSANDRFALNTKFSYGVKVNVGYDVTDKFAPFFVLGHSQTRLDASNYGPNLSFVKESYTNEGFVYGLGFKYSVSNDVDVNAAYELTQYYFTSNLDAVVDGTDKLNSDYKVARLGVSYKF